MSGRQRSFAAGLAVAVGVLWPGIGAGGGLRDLDDAWLVAPDRTVTLLADAEASAHRWQVRAGHGSLYGLPELPQSGLEFERRWAVGSLAAGWQRLGRDPYRETCGQLTLLAGRSWRAGGRVQAAALDLGDGAALRHTALDLVLLAPLPGGLRLQSWLPLTAPPIWYGQRGQRRWLLLEGQGDAWVWAVAADRAPDGRPSLQGEVLLRLVPAAALGLRSEPATGSLGLCTAWRAAGLVLRTSHAVHPDLGPSHRFGLIVGGGR